MRGALSQAGADARPSRGAWLETSAGRLSLKPKAADDAPSGRTRGAALLYPSAEPAQDLALRPTPVGLDAFVQFRAPLESGSFSWQLELPTSYQIRPSGAHGFVVEGAAGGTGSTDTIASAARPLGEDAEGRAVPVSATADRGELEIVVSPAPETVAPVVVQLRWATSGELPAGWWSYGTDEPLDESEFSMLTGEATELGCGYAETGTLEPGEVEMSRQVAALESSCMSLIETGRPHTGSSPDPDDTEEPEGGIDEEPAPADSPETDAAAAPDVHVNRAYYKTIQEDAAQIDVNSVKPVIKWRYGNRCVRRILNRYDRTDAYGPTGWQLDEHNTVKTPRTCGEGTIQTYAKFSGGQFFPACLGSKVTTIYANTIVQGFPAGRAGYHTYHVTGGAPCDRPLHWDSKRGNKVLR